MYSLKPAPGKPGILNLHEGENVKCCPFTIAVPSQDNYGRISLIQQPCGTQCALFEVQYIKVESIGNNLKHMTTEKVIKTRARTGCVETVYYDIEPEPENKISIVK